MIQKIKQTIRAYGNAIKASAHVFKPFSYKLLMIVSALVFFASYLLFPVMLVPGNTLAFELTQITPLNYILLGVLALMTGALLSFEWFAFRRSRGNGASVATEGGAGILASIVAGVLAAASCGCGIGILLGVIGLSGGAVFVASNQTLVILVMLAVVALGLFFSMRRVAGICVVFSL